MPAHGGWGKQEQAHLPRKINPVGAKSRRAEGGGRPEQSKLHGVIRARANTERGQPAACSFRAEQHKKLLVPGGVRTSILGRQI